MTPVEQLWKMMDLITPMALRVVATLRVADHLAEPRRIEELAAAVEADPDSLGRVLRYLVARGVFLEPSPGLFALDELAGLLRDDHPSALRRWTDLAGFGGRMDLAFVDLLATVRTGRPPVDGHKGSYDPATTASYDDVMEAQSRTQAPAVVAACDLAAARHVVDVGGGTGTLLVEVLRTCPDARATLVELPPTAERARPLLAAAGLAPRCDVVAGDLFEVMPAGADVYLWKFVVHSLDDDEAVRALASCRQAAASGARILIIERTAVAGDDLDAFTSMDLRMLILGHGRERTLDEYAEVARRAGLTLVDATPTPIGVHVIELVAG